MIGSSLRKVLCRRSRSIGRLGGGELVLGFLGCGCEGLGREWWWWRRERW